MTPVVSGVVPQDDEKLAQLLGYPLSPRFRESIEEPVRLGDN